MLDLAEHVDRAGCKLAFARLRLGGDLGDDADHDRVAGADAEELADRRAHILRADREAHLRLAAGDRKHAPERTVLRNMIHARLPERFPGLTRRGRYHRRPTNELIRAAIVSLSCDFARRKWPVRACVIKELQLRRRSRRKVDPPCCGAPLLRARRRGSRTVTMSSRIATGAAWTPDDDASALTLRGTRRAAVPRP